MGIGSHMARAGMVESTRDRAPRRERQSRPAKVGFWWGGVRSPHMAPPRHPDTAAQISSVHILELPSGLFWTSRIPYACVLSLRFMSGRDSNELLVSCLGGVWGTLSRVKETKRCCPHNQRGKHSCTCVLTQMDTQLRLAHVSS